jgi:hypothetical protein
VQVIATPPTLPAGLMSPQAQRVRQVLLAAGVRVTQAGAAWHLAHRQRHVVVCDLANLGAADMRALGALPTVPTHGWHATRIADL